MRRAWCYPWWLGRILPACVAGGVLALWGVVAAASDEQDAAVPTALQDDAARAARVVGPDGTANACATCHIVEARAWEQSAHFATFQVRHRTEEAKEVLKAMGLRSMKRSGVCLDCHYTSRLEDEHVRPTWGVSCESCHGGGADYLEIHNARGGEAGAPMLKWGDGQGESTAERRRRLEAAADHGLVHPGRLYDLALNCLGCHTVPNEDLVNRSMHPPGSAFDLVAWSQGEVRHNFVSSPGAPREPTNRPASAARRRKMFIIGTLVDLDMTLRNLASVKEKGGMYHMAMVDRASGGRGKLVMIQEALNLPELAAALAAIPERFTMETVIDPAAAEDVRKAGRAFERAYDGSELGGVDAMIPTDAVGKPFELHR